MYIEKSNAKQLYAAQPHVLREQSLPRLRAIAKTLVEGPTDLFVRRTSKKSDMKRHFEHILRIILDIPNVSYTAWSVFCREREWEAETDQSHPALILRHSIWNLRSDLKNEVYKSGLDQPSVSTSIYYVEKDRYSGLSTYIRNLDTILEQGVSIKPRPESSVWDLG